MIEEIIAFLGLGYVLADLIVFNIAKHKVLTGASQHLITHAYLYSYVPLLNIPQAVWLKWKFGKWIMSADEVEQREKEVKKL